MTRPLQRQTAESIEGRSHVSEFRKWSITMANEAATEWRPEWSVPPGEVLLEALQERGMTQAELARRMGRPVKTINEIIKAKASITPETAIQLELVLGISARFWTGLETLYRQQLAEEESRQRLAGSLEWVQQFPLSALRRHGIIPPGRTPAPEVVAALLRFFGVASVDAWSRQWAQVEAAFRGSGKHVRSSEAVATWLRWGEVEGARSQTSGRFDSEALRQVLQELRPITRVQPAFHAFEQIKERCSAVGVTVVLTPEMPGAPLSGAARWLSPDHALIQLSLRYKRDDQFWFTLYHEAGHLLSPGPRQDVVDDEEASAGIPEEQWADDFARQSLVPEDLYAEFLAGGSISRQRVREFASRIAIAPGIVVGRLQHDGHLPPSHLNDLKKPMHWSDL